MDGELDFSSSSYQGAGFSQGKVCSVAGDTRTLDALGRVTQVQHANGTSVKYQYVGRAIVTTDESDVKRIIQQDALGRTTAVCEISANTGMPQSGSPVNCGLDYPGTGSSPTHNPSTAIPMS